MKSVFIWHLFTTDIKCGYAFTFDRVKEFESFHSDKIRILNFCNYWKVNFMLLMSNVEFFINLYRPFWCGFDRVSSLICGNKMPTRWNRWFAAARKPDTQPSAPHHTDNLKTEAPNTTGSNHLYNTLELLMMGSVVPETCWASNKNCNKNHLFHLVDILFPHII